jgi:hypothetical protein
MKLGKTETALLQRALATGSVNVTARRERAAAVALADKGLLLRVTKWGSYLGGICYSPTDAARTAPPGGLTP